mmetsp:Transcript_20188/g.32700  ORF Transcript_20188/g.32700 Transcript_20188/m.32700 type:complete len:262 (-) Transcript_20188:163-948(-)
MNTESDGDTLLSFTQPGNLEKLEENASQYNDHKRDLYSHLEGAVADPVFVVVGVFRVPLDVHVNNVTSDGDGSRAVVLKVDADVCQLLEVGVVGDGLRHHMPRVSVKEQPLLQKLHKIGGLLTACRNIKVRQETVWHASHLAVREGIGSARFFDIAAALGSIEELRDDISEVAVEHRCGLGIDAVYGRAEDGVHAKRRQGGRRAAARRLQMAKAARARPEVVACLMYKYAADEFVGVGNKPAANEGGRRFEVLTRGHSGTG